MALACVAMACLATTANISFAQRRSVLVVGVASVADGSPITGAEVIIRDLSQRQRTNWIGEATFRDLDPGMHEVRVRRLGFASSDIQIRVGGDSTGLVVMLETVAASLDTVRVMAMRSLIESHREFDHRKAQGLGRFLDEELLERESTRSFPIVAVAHFPGLMLVTGRGGQWSLASREGSCGVDTSFEEFALQGRRSAPPPVGQPDQISGAGGGAQRASGQSAVVNGSCFSAHPCHVKLFLDGVPVAETDINVVHTEELYGVEYYAIGNAPPEYRLSGAACGVMLIWTKAWDGS